jgi:hypothetical protein
MAHNIQKIQNTSKFDTETIKQFDSLLKNDQTRPIEDIASILTSN